MTIKSNAFTENIPVPVVTLLLIGNLFAKTIYLNIMRHYVETDEKKYLEYYFANYLTI